MATLDQFDIEGALQNLMRVGPTEDERKRAASQAFTRMGLGILAANQPSAQPRNPYGVLAQGGLTGLDAHRQALLDASTQRRTEAAGVLSGAKVAHELDTTKRQSAAVENLKTLNPDTLKDPAALYRLALEHNAAGNKELGGTFLSMANHAGTLQNRRDPSQMERGLGRIRELYLKDSMNPGSLNTTERAELADNVAIVGQIRTAIDPVTQKLETFQPLELPEQYAPFLQRYSVKNGKRAEIFPPPEAGGRKQLDAASEKELQGFNDANKQLHGLALDFKPTYGGWKLDTVGEAALAAGRRLSPETLKKMGQEGLGDQSEWWQRYYNWANDIRAAKFGLTLTGNELTAFERSTPKPSDRPERIQAAIENQMKMINDKLQNRTGGLVAGGYNPAQVRETAGHERSLQPNDAAAIAAVQDASSRGMLASSTVKPQVKMVPVAERRRLITEANNAIMRGAPKADVVKVLEEQHGITDHGIR